MSPYYYFEQILFIILGVGTMALFVLLFRAQKFHSGVGSIHQKFHRLGFIVGCLITSMSVDPRGLHDIYHYSVLYVLRDTMFVILFYSAIIWFELVLGVYFSTMAVYGMGADKLKWLKWMFIVPIAIISILTDGIAFATNRKWYRGIPGLYFGIFSFFIAMICFLAVVFLYRDFKHTTGDVRMGTQATKVYQSAVRKILASGIAFAVACIVSLIQGSSTVSQKGLPLDSIVPDPNEADPYNNSPIFIVAVFVLSWVSWIPLKPTPKEGSQIKASNADPVVSQVAVAASPKGATGTGHGLADIRADSTKTLPVALGSAARIQIEDQKPQQV